METICGTAWRHSCAQASQWCSQEDFPTISGMASTTAFGKVSAIPGSLRVESSRNIRRWLWRTRVQASVVGTSDKKLPDKKKALYSHSLPSIEQWLSSLDFCRSKVDRAVWLVERKDWHAQLSLDVAELHIKYLKCGPGNLEKDVERKFSYALSREDLDNAILGGP